MAVKTIILQRLSLRRLNHFVKSESSMLELFCWDFFLKIFIRRSVSAKTKASPLKVIP